MPYKTITEAKKAGFPTTINEVDLTIAQVNHLAKIYDGIKSGGSADEPMAVAIAQFKDAYKIEGNKWITKEAGATAEKTGSWINVAKKDQVKKLLDGEEVILSEEGLKRTAASFKGKDIIINHQVSINEPKILDARYTYPFMQMFFDEEAIKLFRDSDSTGWSVQYDPNTLVFDGNKIVDGVGAGIGLLYGNHTPVCTPEMGCQEQNFTFETYTDIDSNIDANGIKKEIEKIWIAIKGVFDSKSNKKEEEDQENKNRKNLDKRSKMEKEEELTLELKDANDKLAKMESEFETVKTVHSEEVKELKEQVAVFEKEKEDTRTAKIDSNWEQLKKTVIPVGLVHKAEDEKKLKAEFEQSPHAFMMKAFAFERPAATGEEGSEFETNPDEITKATKEMDEAAGMEAPHGN